MLVGIARVAPILAAFRWMAAARANEGWPSGRAASDDGVATAVRGPAQNPAEGGVGVERPRGAGTDRGARAGPPTPGEARAPAARSCSSRCRPGTPDDERADVLWRAGRAAERRGPPRRARPRRTTRRLAAPRPPRPRARRGRRREQPRLPPRGGGPEGPRARAGSRTRSSATGGSASSRRCSART